MIYLPQALIKRHQSTKGKLNEVMIRDKTLNGSQMVSLVKIFPSYYNSLADQVGFC